MTVVLRKPGVADLLAFCAALGIYGVILAQGLQSPSDERLRFLSSFVAGSSLAIILLAVVLDINLRFYLLEIPYSQSAYISADPQERSPGHRLTQKRTAAVTGPETGASPGKPAYTAGKLPEANWKVIKVWEGDHPQKTEIFYIPSPGGAIEWTTWPAGGGLGTFRVQVLDAGGNFIKLTVYTKGPDKDNAFLAGSGKYYLRIDSNQKYKVVVRAKKSR
ncbi:MAG: hypothetical protein ABIG94_02740 [Pseudomonadota bacterium]